jgi:hypothetical protein
MGAERLELYGRGVEDKEDDEEKGKRRRLLPPLFPHQQIGAASGN